MFVSGPDFSRAFRHNKDPGFSPARHRGLRQLKVPAFSSRANLLDAMMRAPGLDFETWILHECRQTNSESFDQIELSRRIRDSMG